MFKRAYAGSNPMWLRLYFTFKNHLEVFSILVERSVFVTLQANDMFENQASEGCMKNIFLLNLNRLTNQKRHCYNCLTAMCTDLISSVVHFHIVTVHIQLHVLVAKHCGRFGVSVVTSHVISQHENYVAGER